MNAGDFSPEDLLYRPIEHTLEWLADPEERLMTCRRLGALIGCDKNRAAELLRGERDLAPAEERRLREWLASCAHNGMVADHERTPARANSRGAATPDMTEVCNA